MCILSSILNNTDLNRGSGLPDDVVKKAAIKSEEFEKTYGNKSCRSNPTNPSTTAEVMVFFQRLRNCLVDADSIHELQKSAKALLEQK